MMRDTTDSVHPQNEAIALPLDLKHSRAYLIGVGKYTHEPWRLKTPENDALDMAELLEDQGFKSELLLNPTLKEFTSFFEKIKTENTDPNGRLLIYYAGHGFQSDSAYGLKGFLIPADALPGDDATMVPMVALQQFIKMLPTRHVLLILDCCFAGTFKFSLTRSETDDATHLDKKLSKQYFDMFTQYPARQVLVSSSSRQKAFDRIESGDRNSPFAQYLLRGIKGEADMHPGDRLITLSELKVFMQGELTLKTAGAGNQQSIGTGSMEGDGDGEFVFFLKDFKAETLEEIHYENPYKGLKSYEPGDSAVYFGRTAAIESLVEKVKTELFTVVTGASGTGKSSLVKAGLLPGKRYKIIRPGKNPMVNLPQHEDDWDILLIDQWEELVTQATDPAEADTFCLAISQWLNTWVIEGQKRIVITVRSDFETYARHESLEPFWNKGRFVVPAFTSEEYEAVMVQPARRVACLFEDPQLVQDIKKEVNGETGPLPLLSFFMEAMFERAKRRHSRVRAILRSDYDALGSLSGALTGRAEEVFQTLQETPEGRDLLRTIMLRMVALSTGEIAGKRVFLEHLDFGADKKNLTKQVVEALTEARLIRNTTPTAEMDAQGNRSDTDAGFEEDHRPYIEPAHDALVRSWKRLREWVKEMGEENLLISAKVGEATLDWIKGDRLPDYLWVANPWVDTVLDWQDSTGHCFFNLDELAFLKASRIERQNRINELKKERDEAVAQKELAEKRAMAAINDSLALRTQHTDPTLALGIAGFNMQHHEDNPNGFAIFHDIISKDDIGLYKDRIDSYDGFNCMCLAKKGNILFAGKSNTILTYDISNKEYKETKQHKHLISGIACDEKGEKVISGASGCLNLLNIPNGTSSDILNVHISANFVVHMSERGKLLVSFGEYPTGENSEIWDIQPDGRHRHFLDGKNVVNALLYIDEKDYIVSAGTDKCIKIWTGTGTLLKTFDKEKGSILSLGFSNTDNYIFSGNEDGSVTCRDLDGNIISRFDAHKEAVTAIDIHPGKKLIITGGKDGIIKLWNYAGNLLKTFIGHHGRVSGVIFYGENSFVSSDELSIEHNNSILFWDIEGKIATTIDEARDLNEMHQTPALDHYIKQNKPLLKYYEMPLPIQNSYTELKLENFHNYAIECASFLNNGQVVTGHAYGWCKLWDRQGRKLVDFIGDDSNIRDIKLSNSGKYIAAHGYGEYAKLWEIIPGQNIIDHVLYLRGHEDPITAIDISNDDRFIITASKDKSIKLWDTTGTCHKTIDIGGEYISFIKISKSNNRFLCAGDKLQIFDETGVRVYEYDFDSSEHDMLDKKEFEKLLDHIVRKAGSGASDFILEEFLMPFENKYYFYTEDNLVQITDKKDNILMSLNHSDHVKSVAYSAQEKKIAASDGGQKLIVWNSLDSYLDHSIWRPRVGDLVKSGCQVDIKTLAALEEQEFLQILEHYAKTGNRQMIKKLLDAPIGEDFTAAAYKHFFNLLGDRSARNRFEEIFESLEVIIEKLITFGPPKYYGYAAYFFQEYSEYRLIEKRQFALSEQMAKRAITFDKYYPSGYIWITLIIDLYAQGKTEEALALITQKSDLQFESGDDGAMTSFRQELLVQAKDILRSLRKRPEEFNNITKLIEFLET